jgi:hypothetical protein
VLFTDENQFYLFEVIYKHMRRSRNTKFNQRYTLATVLNLSSVIDWGSSYGKGVGSLHFLPPNTMSRAANYSTMLQEVPQPTMKCLNKLCFRERMHHATRPKSPAHGCELRTQLMPNRESLIQHEKECETPLVDRPTTFAQV